MEATPAGGFYSRRALSENQNVQKRRGENREVYLQRTIGVLTLKELPKNHESGVEVIIFSAPVIEKQF